MECVIFWDQTTRTYKARFELSAAELFTVASYIPGASSFNGAALSCAELNAEVDHISEKSNTANGNED